MVSRVKFMTGIKTYDLKSTVLNYTMNPERTGYTIMDHLLSVIKIMYV